MTNEQHDPAAEGGRTVSVVRLEGDQWVAVNVDDPTITHHAASLTDVLFAHRHAVTFRLRKEPVLRYLIGDEATAVRIERIRTASAEVAELRRAANHAETQIRAKRVALMRQLAGLQVTPGEIAQIVGVPTTAVPKDLGTDRDAHLARALLSSSNPPDAPERIF